MISIKRFVLLISAMFICSALYAQEKYVPRTLTMEQLGRVTACQSILKEVRGKSLQQTIDGLSRLPYIEENIQIMEAMVKTYTDIVAELKVTEQSKKEGLYSLVELNMAYLQLGGVKSSGSREPLYGLIRGKLKSYLSAKLLNNSTLFHSLD